MPTQEEYDALLTQLHNAEADRNAANTRADNAEADRDAANTRADNAEADRNAANTRADNAEADRNAANTRADNAEAVRQVLEEQIRQLRYEKTLRTALKVYNLHLTRSCKKDYLRYRPRYCC